MNEPSQRVGLFPSNVSGFSLSISATQLTKVACTACRNFWSWNRCESAASCCAIQLLVTSSKFKLLRARRCRESSTATIPCSSASAAAALPIFPAILSAACTTACCSPASPQSSRSRKEEQVQTSRKRQRHGQYSCTFVRWRYRVWRWIGYCWKHCQLHSRE